MKFVKLFIIIISLGLLSISCTSEKSNLTIINCNFNDSTNGWWYLSQILPTEIIKIDSAQSDNSGLTSMEIIVPQAGIYELSYNKKQSIMLVIEPGEVIDITGNTENIINSYSIKGSPNSEAYIPFAKSTYIHYKLMDSLTNEYRIITSLPEFSNLKPIIDKSFNQVILTQNKNAQQFVKHNIKSLASLLVINSRFGPNSMLSIATDYDLLKQYTDSISKYYPENPLAVDFKTRFDNFERENSNLNNTTAIQVNELAPEIQLPDMGKRTRKLSETRNKITILYFWSAFDKNSRIINNQLNTIYSEFKNKGLEIFSVSLDSDFQAFKETIQKDKAYWIQTIDTTNLNSIYLKEYGITSLPSMFLLDKEGKIIEINPTQAILKERIFSLISN